MSGFCIFFNFCKLRPRFFAASKEIRNILGKDNSSEELALKKKELALKEKQLTGDTGENDIVKNWVEAVISGDENEE